MKRLICLALCLTLTFSTAVTVLANDTIVIEDSSAETEVKNEEKKEEDVAKPEENKEEAKSEEKTELVVTKQNAYLALGKDLTPDQLATVLGIMGIDPARLAEYNVVYVTHEDEKNYLGSYIDASVIGSKSLSSVLVRPASTGHGVTVDTKNINYCNTTMYQNALITAGVTDAEVLVVGPTPISGTAALIGALKAYEQMSGTPVSEKALDTALDELVTTGEIKDALGDDKQAMELISYIKAQIAANDLNTREEIEAAVRKGNKELNANLTEDQIKQIVDTMVKIKAMGIDFNVLAEQAETIYAKYGDQIKAGTFNIDDVDWSDLGIGKIISNAVGNFFKEVGSSVKGFFSGLFGKKK
ncbi:MAG: DUF1002 domain-containing protein [Lachnospiraceae bacterium]|nr:DUF1002 domain-containing protein [Lachnospiraceae bacterium]